MLGVEESSVDDHAPIIARKHITKTAHGGYEVWSSGCICGWQSRSPGYFIPSKRSAEKTWERHLKTQTGVDLETLERSIDDEYEQLQFDLDLPPGYREGWSPSKAFLDPKAATRH